MMVFDIIDAETSRFLYQWFTCRWLGSQVAFRLGSSVGFQYNAVDWLYNQHLIYFLFIL